MSVIQLGEGNTSGVMAPLIPFNCVFDTDFGLLTLINKEYFDSSVFSIDFFNQNSSIKNLVRALYEREEENPLSVCLLPEKKDLSESLYKDFISKRYDSILKLSMPTEVYNILELFKLSGDIKPTIVCESEIEEQFLDKFKVTKGIQKIRVEELKEVNFYQQFYFKSINDFYSDIISEFIDTKMIYIADYKFNVDEERNIKDNKNTLLMGLSRNKFRLFEIYDRNNLKGE